MSKKIILLLTTLIISQQARAMKELGMERQFIDFSHGKRVDPNHRLTDHPHDQNLVHDLSKAIFTSSSDAFYKLMDNLRDHNKIQENPENSLLNQWLPKLRNTNDVVISNLQREKETPNNRLWMLGSGSTTLLFSGCGSVIGFQGLKNDYTLFIKTKALNRGSFATLYDLLMKTYSTMNNRDKMISILFSIIAIPSIYGLYTGGKKVYNGLRYTNFIENKLLASLKIHALLEDATHDNKEPEYAPEVAELSQNLRVAQLLKPSDFN